MNVSTRPVDLLSRAFVEWTVVAVDPPEGDEMWPGYPVILAYARRDERVRDVAVRSALAAERHRLADPGT